MSRTRSDRSIFLVTGGSGLLGSYLIPVLLKKVNNCRIIVIDRKHKKRPWCNDKRVRIILGDLRRRRVWAKVPKNITRLFYLAAFIPWGRMQEDRASIAIGNTLPLAHLVEYSRDWPRLRQVIYSSSMSVYAKTNRGLRESSPKNPPNIYGASKLAGEDMLSCLESRGIKVATLRYSSLYGCGQYTGTVLPLMINNALTENEIFVYGRGRRTQDFLYCNDAAEANLRAYRKNATGAFNIGSGVPVTMGELAGAINDVFCTGKGRIVYVPEKDDRDQGYKMDISRARKMLEYRPITKIRDGLTRLKKDCQKVS